jgi:hypothetical protein
VRPEEHLKLITRYLEKIRQNGPASVKPFDRFIERNEYVLHQVVRFILVVQANPDKGTDPGDVPVHDVREIVYLPGFDAAKSFLIAYG